MRLSKFALPLLALGGAMPLLAQASFDEALSLFASGTPVSETNLRHPLSGKAKPSWAGECFSASGDSLKTELSVLHKPDSIRFALNTEWKKTGLFANPDEIDRSGSYYVDYARPSQTVGSSSVGYVSEYRGNLFSENEIIVYGHELRQVTRNGKTAVIGIMREPVRIVESQIGEAFERIPSAPAMAACILDRQYLDKVTRGTDEAASCVASYEKAAADYKKGRRGALILTAVAVVINPVVGIPGAIGANSITSPLKDAAADALEAAELLKELRNGEAPGPRLSALHAAVLEKNPELGSIEDLRALLLLADRSSYFCSPNVAGVMSRSLIAQQLIDGTLSASKFID